MDTFNFDLFRSNLRKLRTAKGYTGEELSSELGFTKKRIADLEETRRKCKPKVNEIVNISKYFNIPMDDILTKEAIVTVNFVIPETSEIRA